MPNTKIKALSPNIGCTSPPPPKDAPHFVDNTQLLHQTMTPLPHLIGQDHPRWEATKLKVALILCVHYPAVKSPHTDLSSLSDINSSAV